MAGPIDYGRIIGRKPFRPFSAYLPPEIKISKENNDFSLISPQSFDPLNENIDLQWAGKVDDTNKFNNYYDYYFSGEDIKVYIDGLFDAGDELDMAGFAFTISQQKAPLFGFWSYNYDVMMTGTRIVNGQMTIHSRYPGRMKDLLSKAAKVRTDFYSDKPSSQIQSYLRSDSEDIEDEKNVQKWWANSQLDRLGSDGRGSVNRNIFSAHPPFNFVIKYGTQEGSMTTLARNEGTQSDSNYDTLDRLMSLDVNDRLVQRNPSGPFQMDIVLQSVHLNSMSTSYAAGGMLVIESYDFTARDMYVSDGKLKEPENGTITVNEQKGSLGTDPNKVQAPPTQEQLLTIKDRAVLFERPM